VFGKVHLKTFVGYCGLLNMAGGLARLSGNAMALINVVALRRARLVLG